jgi:hypothetical protein
MEISKETKLKVALQYYGCDFLVCYNLEGNPVIEKFGKNFELNMYEPDLENKRDLLILKPQSTSMAFRVKDYEAMEKIRSMTEELSRFMGTVSKEDFFNKLILSNFLSYQYAISQGIDMPQYLLGGKTLKEAGMAIYEDEVLSVLD